MSRPRATRNGRLAPASKPSGRARRLAEAYTFIVGEIEALGREAEAGARRQLGSLSTTTCWPCGSRWRAGTDSGLDPARFAANLGFWAALAWLEEQPAPDQRCLAELRRCAEGPCDYADAACAALSQSPREDAYGQGLAAWARGDLAAAIERFGRHLERAPDDGAAFTWRGMSRLRTGDPARALEDFDRAVKLDPDDAPRSRGAATPSTGWGVRARRSTRGSRRRGAEGHADRVAPPAFMTR